MPEQFPPSGNKKPEYLPVFLICEDFPHPFKGLPSVRQLILYFCPYLRNPFQGLMKIPEKTGDFSDQLPDKPLHDLQQAPKQAAADSGRTGRIRFLFFPVFRRRKLRRPKTLLEFFFLSFLFLGKRRMLCFFLPQPVWFLRPLRFWLPRIHLSSFWLLTLWPLGFRPFFFPFSRLRFRPPNFRRLGRFAEFPAGLFFLKRPKLFFKEPKPQNLAPGERPSIIENPQADSPKQPGNQKFPLKFFISGSRKPVTDRHEKDHDSEEQDQKEKDQQKDSKDF